ncbi:MAG: peptidase MA family metallohydrolase [Chloroflexota bacterium]|nr:peptidase MA family metallohydrolase [Chloroflexota bacterium]
MKSSRLLWLLSPLLALPFIVLGARAWQARDASEAPLDAIDSSLQVQRAAALRGDRAAFLQMQDPAVTGWRDYQSRVFERDRPLHSRLRDVAHLRVEGVVAFVTVSLEGPQEPWVMGTLYRQVGGEWLHSTPTEAERGRLLTARRDGFELQYNEWDAGQVPWLQESLVRARKAVRDSLGTAPTMARARLHASPLTLPVASFSSNAYYDPRAEVIEVLSPYYWPRPEKKSHDTRMLTHEYAHLAVDQAGGEALPLWVDEGLAMLIAGEWDADAQHTLAGYLARGQVVPLEKLPDAFGSNDPTRAYVTSGALTDYLVRTHGMDAVRSVLREVSRGVPADEALMEATGRSSAELYEDWYREARSGAR